MLLRMPLTQADTAEKTLPFEEFWQWLTHHANCIVRAGTPESMLFDHEDFHWHLAADDQGTLIVQLVRGKALVGELVIFGNEVSYVQCEAGEGDETLFELIVESSSNKDMAYHFVMAHGFDETEEPSTPRRWTH